MTENFGKRIFWCMALTVVGGGLYLLNNHWGSIAGGLNVQRAFEKNIPFISWTILIYYLIFPYLAMPVFTVPKYGDFCKVICGYFVITAVSAAIFFTIPTTMPRPDIVADGWMRYLFEGIYFVDGPHNLFPSLHVSSVSYVGFINWRFCGKKFGVASALLAILICLSTLTTKQHAVVDVVGGVMLGWAAFYAFFGKRV